MTSTSEPEEVKMPTKKTAKTTDGTKTQSVEERMEEVLREHEQRILKKFDQLNADVEALATQVVLAQKALAENLGVDLNEVWARMQPQEPREQDE